MSTTVKEMATSVVSDTVFEMDGEWFYRDDEGEMSAAFATHTEALAGFIEYCNWMNDGGRNG